MPTTQSRKSYLSGGEAPKLVAAFAKGDLELVLGGTVGDLPYAFASQGAARRAPVRPCRRAVRLGSDRASAKRFENATSADLLSQRHRSRSTDCRPPCRTDFSLAPRYFRRGLKGIGSPQQPAWLGQPAIERRQIACRRGAATVRRSRAAQHFGCSCRPDRAEIICWRGYAMIGDRWASGSIGRRRRRRPTSSGSMKSPPLLLPPGSSADFAAKQSRSAWKMPIR